jgi:N-acylneuraminate cytidylyltransferase
MIAWSIEVAKESTLFDHIIVSTDDIEIADIAKACGAEVPFIRPIELSDDYASTTEVVAHAASWSIEQGWPVSAVCCIYATAPFVKVDDIKRGLTLLELGNWAYAFSATDFAAPIFRAFKQVAEGGVEMFSPEHFATRSQDLPVALHDAGQFYWGRPAAWIESRRIFDRHSVPIIIPRWRVQDIDNQEDWIRAELIYNQLKDSKV